MGFPGGSEVKNPSDRQRTHVLSLDQEDLLEKEMATHSSTLAWKILWTEEPGRLQSMWSDTTEQLHSLMSEPTTCGIFVPDQRSSPEPLE